MIDLIIILTACLLLIYICNVNSWRKVWANEKEYVSAVDNGVTLSVIIPFKDEATNLEQLLDSLKAQQYKRWELILVNDYSVDHGVDIIKRLKSHFPVPLILIDNDGVGKKSALLTGVKIAKNDFVVTSDADCFFHCNWLQSMATFQQQSHADLIIGPVMIKPTKGFLSRFQLLDFAALQLSGAASAISQRAIMCNGANLLCSKELYINAKLKSHMASGDDMFLLEWAKRNDKIISYIKNKQAIVQTNPVDDVKGFLMQRARWASKAPAYRDMQIMLAGFLVGSLSFMLISLLMVGLSNNLCLFAYATAIPLKSLFDYQLLYKGKTFFNYNLSFFEVLVFQLLYPIYVVTVLIFPLFIKVSWKDRNIQ